MSHLFGLATLRRNRILTRRLKPERTRIGLSVLAQFFTFKCRFPRACRMTDPMLTDLGLCRSINAAKITDIYASTEYMDAFADSVVEASNNSLVGEMISGNGPGNIVRLVLDFQEHMHK